MQFVGRFTPHEGASLSVSAACGPDGSSIIAVAQYGARGVHVFDSKDRASRFVPLHSPVTSVCVARGPTRAIHCATKDGELWRVPSHAESPDPPRPPLQRLTLPATPAGTAPESHQFARAGAKRAGGERVGCEASSSVGPRPSKRSRSGDKRLDSTWSSTEGGHRSTASGFDSVVAQNLPDDTQLAPGWENGSVVASSAGYSAYYPDGQDQKGSRHGAALQHASPPNASPTCTPVCVRLRRPGSRYDGVCASIGRAVFGHVLTSAGARVVLEGDALGRVWCKIKGSESTQTSHGSAPAPQVFELGDRVISTMHLVDQKRECLLAVAANGGAVAIAGSAPDTLDHTRVSLQGLGLPGGVDACCAAPGGALLVSQGKLFFLDVFRPLADNENGSRGSVENASADEGPTKTLFRTPWTLTPQALSFRVAAVCSSSPDATGPAVVVTRCGRVYEIGVGCLEKDPLAALSRRLSLARVATPNASMGVAVEGGVSGGVAGSISVASTLDSLSALAARQIALRKRLDMQNARLASLAGALHLARTASATTSKLEAAAATSLMPSSAPLMASSASKSKTPSVPPPKPLARVVPRVKWSRFGAVLRPARIYVSVQLLPSTLPEQLGECQCAALLVEIRQGGRVWRRRQPLRIPASRPRPKPIETSVAFELNGSLQPISGRICVLYCEDIEGPNGYTDAVGGAGNAKKSEESEQNAVGTAGEKNASIPANSSPDLYGEATFDAKGDASAGAVEIEIAKLQFGIFDMCASFPPGEGVASTLSARNAAQLSSRPVLPACERLQSLTLASLAAQLRSRAVDARGAAPTNDAGTTKMSADTPARFSVETHLPLMMPRGEATDVSTGAARAGDAAIQRHVCPRTLRLVLHGAPGLGRVTAPALCATRCRVRVASDGSVVAEADIGPNMGSSASRDDDGTSHLLHVAVAHRKGDGFVTIQVSCGPDGDTALALAARAAVMERLSSWARAKENHSGEKCPNIFTPSPKMDASDSKGNTSPAKPKPPLDWLSTWHSTVVKKRLPAQLAALKQTSQTVSLLRAEYTRVCAALERDADLLQAGAAMDQLVSRCQIELAKARAEVGGTVL